MYFGIFKAILWKDMFFIVFNYIFCKKVIPAVFFSFAYHFNGFFFLFVGQHRPDLMLQFQSFQLLLQHLWLLFFQQLARGDFVKLLGFDKCLHRLMRC